MKEAMNKYADQATFKTFFSPFFLNENIPEQGMKFTQYWKDKTGMEVNINDMKEQMAHMYDYAKRCNPPINFAPIHENRMVRNTMKTHRLFQYLLDKHGSEKQVEVVVNIMKGYFEKEEDINDIQILSRLSGLQVEELQFLEKKQSFPSNQDILIKANQTKYEYGINGVPYFIIQERFKFSGAQEPKVFEGFFNKIIQQSIKEKQNM